MKPTNLSEEVILDMSLYDFFDLWRNSAKLKSEKDCIAHARKVILQEFLSEGYSKKVSYLLSITPEEMLSRVALNGVEPRYGEKTHFYLVSFFLKVGFAVMKYPFLRGPLPKPISPVRGSPSMDWLPDRELIEPGLLKKLEKQSRKDWPSYWEE